MTNHHDDGHQPVHHLTEATKRAGTAALLNKKTIFVSGVIMAAFGALVTALMPLFDEIRHDLTRVDTEARQDIARVDRQAEFNTEVQQRAFRILMEAISDRIEVPVIVPVGLTPARLVQVACEDTPRPAVCGIEVDLNARLERVPPTCGSVQLEITLLRLAEGALPGALQVMESWVIADLTDLIPPDRDGVLVGTLELPTREPIYPGTRDDLLWTYTPRCGAAGAIQAFDGTVFDRPLRRVTPP